MRWRQFFTPVESLSSQQAQTLLNDTPAGEIGLLDVRQPSEYNEGHIAGATLIPLPLLSEEYHTLDKDRPIIVYCAIGGRSRVAAQQLAGRGFTKVYNLSGGYKAWAGHSAYGRAEIGLELFPDLGKPEEILLTAYSLEQGLQDFYISMAEKTDRQEVGDIFRQLATIEDIHKKDIFAEYERITGESDLKRFEERMHQHVMEGGMTTEEYLDRFGTDLSKADDVISLAMSIEAQAYDLYSRAALQAENEQSRDVLEKIAQEETLHMKKLGSLMDTIMEAADV